MYRLYTRFCLKNQHVKGAVDRENPQKTLYTELVDDLFMVEIQDISYQFIIET